MAGFYSARSSIMPPLPWPTFAPPLSGKLIDHDRRIQAAEADIEHLPDREATHRIEMTMAQIMGRLDAQDAVLSGKFAAMDERLKPIQAIGERLQDVLIEQARNVA